MEGTIKRITDKGFGFISDGSDKDMFFHSSAVEGGAFDSLREGQKVRYEVGRDTVNTEVAQGFGGQVGIAQIRHLLHEFGRDAMNTEVTQGLRR